MRDDWQETMKERGANLDGEDLNRAATAVEEIGRFAKLLDDDVFTALLTILQIRIGEALADQPLSFDDIAEIQAVVAPKETMK